MKTKVFLTWILAVTLAFALVMTVALVQANHRGRLSDIALNDQARTINVLEHRANNAEIALAFCADKFKRSPKNKRVKVIPHKGGVAIRIGW